MRILTINFGIPHPNEGASTILYHYYLTELCKMGVLRNILVLTAEWKDEAVEDFRKRMTRLGVESVHVFRTVFNVKRNGSKFYVDKEMVSAVESCAKDFQPNVTIEFDLYASMVAFQIRGPVKIAWLGDLNFDTKKYHAIYAWQERRSNLPRLIQKLWIARLWRAAYAQTLCEHHAVVVSSKSSEQRLQPLNIHAVYLPYPWPAVIHKEMSTYNPPSKPSFVFFGTLGALGSRSALNFLLRRLYPLMVRMWGNNGFVLSICGRGNLPQWAKKWMRSHLEIVFHGFIPNVDDLLRNAHALIVPIDVPVGNRSRILTALAMSIPVVAHVNTALGNPDLVHGWTCRLAKNVHEFVEQMRQVMECPVETASIVQRGLEMYCRRFAPEMALRLFADYVRATVEADNNA